MASHFQYDGPFNRDPGPNEVGIIVYGYWPSLALGVVGTITFGIALIVNTYYAITRKGHYRTFSALLAAGCLAEVGGYVTRIFSHYKPYNLSAYIASSSMIIMAPVLFAAGIDFTLNILSDGFEGSRPILLLSPRKILWIFIGIDVFALSIQGIGAAMVGYTTSSFFNDEDTFIQYEQANSILIAGLSLQVFTWVVFILFVLVSTYRAYTLPQLKGNTWYDNMRYMLWTSFFAAVLLLWRACYRLAEVVLGYLSGPATREDYLAGFEYLPVVLAIITLTAFPPHFFVERRRKGTPTSAGVGDMSESGMERGAVQPVRSGSSAETVVADERGNKAGQ